MDATSTANLVQWKNHNGSAPREESVFFLQPDPSIGEVISATSNVSKKSKNRLSLYERRRRFRTAKKTCLRFGLWLSLLLEIAIALVTFSEWMIPISKLKQHPLAFFIVVSSIPLVLMGITFLLSFILYPKPSQQCTFVGRAGLQRSSEKTEILRFSDVKSLMVRTNFDKLVPEAISYVFLGQQNRPLLTIHVLESLQNMLEIPVESSLFFALQAEKVWTSQRITQIEEEIASRGLAWIDIGPKLQLGLGPNQMFLKQGTVHRTFSPQGGQLSIKLSPGAFELELMPEPQENLSGITCFMDFAELKDAKVALYLIESVLKIPIFTKPIFHPGIV